MGKTTIEQQKNKQMIARDKFCDGDFDKLVIETSRSIIHRDSDGLLRPTPTGSGCDDDHQVAISESPTPKISLDHSRLNQPKRPMNAFMVWGQAIRRELHHKFSNVQNALLSKALGRVWRSLDPTEKEPFVRRANLIKANHKRDYPNYRYQPRRVQERRARNNMLIGINLNHPVNQLQNQQSSAYFSDQTTAGPTNHQLAHSSLEYHSHLAADDNRKLRGHSISRRSLIGEPQPRDLSKDTIDGVQTFEYHPYPTAVGEATFECNNCRPTTNGGCQNDVNYREGQHQTSIYLPYEQSTYNMHHPQNQHHHLSPQQHHYHHNNHHHQQQQHLLQQSFSYEAIQHQQTSNHMVNCGSISSTINNPTGHYNGR